MIVNQLTRKRNLLKLAKNVLPQKETVAGEKRERKKEKRRTTQKQMGKKEMDKKYNSLFYAYEEQIEQNLAVFILYSQNTGSQ